MGTESWPDLWTFLSALRVASDQRMLTAFQMCPRDRSVHDVHVLRALFRTNAAFVRHPYAKEFFDAFNMPDPGEEIDGLTRVPLGGRVVPSLEETLRLASRAPVISTNSFLSAWARISLENGGSPSQRSFLIKWLMGDADTPEGGIYDAPDLESFLKAMSALPQTADDIQYILALEGDEIIFRPVSVVNDYIQRSDLGKIVPYRSLLTHFRDQFGLFTSDQIEELESLINERVAREAEFQAFLERNPHFLRRGDYREVHPHPYLCHQDESTLIPDFILTNRQLAKAVIVDLKLPYPTIIRRQTNRERFASAVMEARAQLLRYRDWFRARENRHSLTSIIGFEIYEPRLAVIIGRSSEFEDSFDRQRLAAGNPEIEVVTYDDLITYARQRRVLLGP